MNLKKPISAAMAAMMTLSVTATPALAAVEDPPGTSTQADETDADTTLGEQSSAEEDALESSDTSEKSHQDAKVYASANGSYILTVPESINLHNIEKKDLGSGLYTNDKNCKVNLRGDVRQDQVVVVTVTEPVMQSEGSKDVDANVDTSSKTVWNRDDLFTGATAGEDGSYTEPTGVTTVYPVSAELTPGDWVGTAMFNCSLETTSSIVSAITGIDPDSFDYDGQEHTPGLIFADGSAPVEGRDYVISGDTAKVEEGDYTLTVTGSGKYYGEASFAWKIKRYDISASLDQSSFVADDAEHAPNIIWGASNPVEGVDYDISGTRSATDPGNYTITITGKGKYKGTLTLDWTITATDIATIVDGLDENAFGNDGLEHAPNIVWKNGYSPVEGKDYEISGTTSSSEDGTYTITIKGKGKYTGQVDLEWRIAPKQDIASINAKLDPTDFIADDTEHAPTIVWPDGSKLTENVDYTIGGTQSATAVGDYTITITGKGKYKGTLDLNWTISATDIATVIEGLDQDSFANDGEEHNPEVVWKDGKVLVEGKDYDLSGDTSATDEGTYTITITGKGNYDGSVSYTWAVSTVDISIALAGITPEHFDYDGEEHSPELIWAEGYSGIEDIDYTLSCDVSKSDNGDYTLKVIGKGKYKGTVSFDWNIRELIPVGEIYTVYLTGEQLIGDGKLVYFPLNAYDKDTYTDVDYTYTYSSYSDYSTAWDVRTGWSVKVNDTSKTAYGAIRHNICDKAITNMYDTFSGCNLLLDAPAIPETVTNMASTFENCYSLVKAPAIPNRVELMGSGDAFGTGTFYGCSSLEIAPNLPDSVGNVSGLFFGCASLRSYEGSVDPDGDFSNFKLPRMYCRNACDKANLFDVFRDCKKITKAPAVPDGVTFMTNTFYNCTSLAEAPVIPDSVTDMNSTFSGCISLAEAPVISDSVTSMYSTFSDCTSLTEVPAIPNSVTYMGSTFSGCTSLTEAPVIPDNVTNMRYTFSGCTSLTEAPMIPNSVTDMDGTFYGCKSLTEAPVIPDIVTDMESTFSGWTSLTEAPVIPDSVTDMRGTFSGCTSLVEAPVIPDKVTNMSGTFSGCTSLTAAPVIPDSVTDMESTFSGCTSLKTYVDSTDPDGDFSNYVIPDSVTHIYMSGTFSGCTSLVEAPVIPGNASNISRIFNGCSSLTGTLICNADFFYGSNYEDALKGTQITAIKGSCSGTMKIKLLKSTGRKMLTNADTKLVSDAIKYDGAVHTPQIQYNGMALTQGIDYIVTNDFDKTELGDYSTTYTGIGNYVGSISFKWSISTNVISDAIQGLSAVHYDYDGETHAPSLVWNNGFEALVNERDYSVSGTQSAIDRGHYIITVKGMGEYAGTVSFDWSIGELIPDGAIYTIKSTKKSLTGDGLSVVFPATAENGDIYEDVDYKYSCSSGNWTVVVKDKTKVSYGALRGDIGGKKLTSLSIAFRNCTAMTEAPDIPDSVVNMYRAFEDCTSLVEAPEIPDSVGTMEGAFYGCTALVKASVIPDSVTNMMYSFKDCTSLSGILICNANLSSYYIRDALKGSKITAIEGSCSESTKTKLLATR